MTDLGRRIIIDTDPGIDDALAISLAVASGLEIDGITTIFGNVRKASSCFDLVNTHTRTHTHTNTQASKQASKQNYTLSKCCECLCNVSNENRLTRIAHCTFLGRCGELLNQCEMCTESPRVDISSGICLGSCV
jgi:hypothetical protein